MFGLIFISYCYNKTPHKEVEMPTINDRETIKDYFTYLYNLSKLSKTDFAKELGVSQHETYNPNSKDNKFEIRIIGKVLWNESRRVI